VKLLIGAVLLVAAANAANTATAAHQAPALARVTLPDGSVRTLAFGGLGCSWSVCSRTHLRSKTDSTWLDTVATIKETSEAVADQPRSSMLAVVVLKDGTEQRRVIVSDFRYLYFTDRSGAAGKLDLAKVKSLEFLD
jgi:hypothetical protein